MSRCARMAYQLAPVPWRQVTEALRICWREGEREEEGWADLIVSAPQGPCWREADATMLWHNHWPCHSSSTIRDTDEAVCILIWGQTKHILYQISSLHASSLCESFVCVIELILECVTGNVSCQVQLRSIKSHDLIPSFSSVLGSILACD